MLVWALVDLLFETLTAKNSWLSLSIGSKQNRPEVGEDLDQDLQTLVTAPIDLTVSNFQNGGRGETVFSQSHFRRRNSSKYQGLLCLHLKSKKAFNLPTLFLIAGRRLGADSAFPHDKIGQRILGEILYHDSDRQLCRDAELRSLCASRPSCREIGRTLRSGSRRSWRIWSSRYLFTTWLLIAISWLYSHWSICRKGGEAGDEESLRHGQLLPLHAHCCFGWSPSVKTANIGKIRRINLILIKDYLCFSDWISHGGWHDHFLRHNLLSRFNWRKAPEKIHSLWRGAADFGLAKPCYLKEIISKQHDLTSKYLIFIPLIKF